MYPCVVVGPGSFPPVYLTRVYHLWYKLEGSILYNISPLPDTTLTCDWSIDLGDKERI